MRIFIATVAIVAIATGSTPALANPRSGSDVLLKALKTMKADSAPPGQSTRPQDPDKGDDHTALRAISEVCTKDTPAADRSAICPRIPISPE